MRSSHKEKRLVESRLALCQFGILVALAAYYLSSSSGAELIGVGFSDDKELGRYEMVMRVVWTTIFLVSFLTNLLIEFSLGLSNRGQFSPSSGAELKSGDNVFDGSVDAPRVRVMANMGFTISLAAAFLMVTCNLAQQENIRVDMSYFKTASPGDATTKLAAIYPIKVYLYFDSGSEVKREVQKYFQELKRKGGKITIEKASRYDDVALVKKYGVKGGVRGAKKGTVVLVYEQEGGNEVHKTIDLHTNLKDERKRNGKLRKLDVEIHRRLMEIIRKKKTVYLTVGHSELNEKEMPPGLGTKEIKKLLADMNYRVKDLSLLGTGKVPKDADILMVLAPKEQLLPEEIDVIDEYLEKGGAALIALNADGKHSMGKLEGRLGVKTAQKPLLDDRKNIYRQPTFLLTSQISAHPAVSTISKVRNQGGLIFPFSGALVDVKFTHKNAPKRTYVVRSEKSSFLDENKNYRFDGKEKRKRYNIVAAIEGKKVKAKPKKGKNKSPKAKSMRAIVIADPAIFMDFIQGGVPLKTN